MTCIVGLEFNGKTYIAGDLQATSGDGHKIIHTQPKIFKLSEIICGFTNSYRFGQILEHYFNIKTMPRKDENIYKWLVTSVVPEVIKVLKDNNFEMDEENCGNFLFGVYDQLWEFQEDYSVLRSKEGFAVIGAGAKYATAVMSYAMSQCNIQTEQDVKLLLQKAIEITSEYSSSVGKESNIINT
jgi:ATP-dependent protease HslVU (ClpYQ) peptidase subunit